MRLQLLYGFISSEIRHMFGSIFILLPAHLYQKKYMRPPPFPGVSQLMSTQPSLYEMIISLYETEPDFYRFYFNCLGIDLMCIFVTYKSSV